MATSTDTFRTRFPEYCDESEYSDDLIELYLADAIEDIGTDEDRWLGKYDRAQAYLAAHLLAVAVGQAAGDASAISGPIQSVAAGGVSVSRSVVAKSRSNADDFYLTTSYGQQFVMIRNSCFVGVMVVGE